MIEFLINKDIELLIYLNNAGTVQWDGFWLFITNKLSAIPLYLWLLYLSYKQYGLKNTALIVLFVGLLILAADQTSNFFKETFQRLRPCRDPALRDLIRLVKPSCGGKYAYFSAHAANTMGVAIFFSRLLGSAYKTLPYLLIAWSLVVAYSRVYLGMHFPLDILTGIFVGILYAYLVAHLCERFIKMTRGAYS